MMAGVQRLYATCSGNRFARFLAVGVVNTGVGYLMYLLGLLARLTPEAALAVATALGAVFNYFSTGRVVFANRSLGRLPMFLASYAVIYLVNVLAIRELIGAGLWPAIAQAVLLPVMAVISFLVFRTVVFRRPAAV